MDATIQEIVNIIREVTVYRLSNCDGCMCGGFALKGVHVSIGCGKGGGRAVNVWPQHNGDFEDEDARLMPIGEETARQVMEADGRGPMKIFLHNWRKEDQQ